jgi:chloride channel protein, CIC family
MDLRKLLSEEDRISYVYLTKWMAVSFAAGVLASCMVHLFSYLLSVTSLFLATSPLPRYVWPLAGALVAGGLIYRFEHHAAGEGIPSYIQALRRRATVLPIRITVGKFCAAFATLATFGNGGIVGPLGRVCAGLLSSGVGLLTGKGTFWNDDDRRTAAICAMAATVGTIFHSPIGGGIFAVEIIQKAKMGYRDLFPAILSSVTAVFICNALGWERFYRFSAVDAFMDVSLVGWLALLAIIAGGAGGAYTVLYAQIARLFGRRKGNVLLKVIIGSLIASVGAWLVNPALMGTSKEMVTALFNGDYSLLSGRLSGNAVPLAGVLLLMLLLKGLFNCVTVGSGMSAGFTGPAVIMGLLSGVVMAHLLGIPAGTASYHAFLAAGFTAMLAGSMNIPLAAAVMTIELFGLQYSFPAGFSAVIGFQVMRHRTIYDYAVSCEEDAG